MATTETFRRRLIRTKEAAAYLSISDWKLRRLIQEGIVPVVQDHDGGPFLLDLRDLDSYIDSHKHLIPDDLSEHAKIPVASVQKQARTGVQRAE
jgi:excisionase family DNA binding protein